MTFNAQSLVRPGRLNLIATYMIDKNIHVAGLQGTRLGGGRKEYRIRASPLDTKSAQFVVFQWGYGATSRLKVADGGTNMSTGVSLVLRPAFVAALIHQKATRPSWRSAGPMSVLARKPRAAREDHCCVFTT